MSVPVPTKFETQLFINNEYVDAKSGETLSLSNPFDSAKIDASVQVGGESDVAAAVSAAQAAFKTGLWSTYTGAQRAVPMLKFVDLLDKYAKELAVLDTISMGEPIAPNAMFIIPEAAAVFRYYAGWADKIEGESFNADDGTYKIVRHEPLGICAGIAPWNGPILYVGWKIAPALAAGNTGSTAVGKIVQRAALDSNIKKVTLELGGESPAIVFADADIENAVGSAADGFLFNSAQVCVVGSRLFVQKAIAPAFIEAVKSHFADISSKLGYDPLEFGIGHGPLADEKQFNRVMNYIDIGKKIGTPIIGGTRKGDNVVYQRVVNFCPHYTL